MLIHDIVLFFEEESPTYYAEDFDNVGLLVGDKNAEVTGILVCHDSLASVIDEAIREECNLIVSFHPIIFSGLKKLTGKTYVERVVMKAIRHNIAIFAIHTALDNHWNGVNAAICERLNLNNRRILIPQKNTIKKLTTFVPKAEANQLREALFAAGAGSIGNYENCSFNIEGFGTFKGNEASNPTKGQRGTTHTEAETQIGITFPAHLESIVLDTLFTNHSYEEVAYEVITLENKNQKIGMGMIGELEIPMPAIEFLKYLKKSIPTDCIRHSQLLDREVKKVAVLGGSGSFAIAHAKSAGADVFVTADLKYHDFYQAENKLILADIGHYESEQFTKNEMLAFLTKKITNFAPALEKPKVVLSKENTNPIKYL